jgi:hypothetical protein
MYGPQFTHSRNQRQSTRAGVDAGNRRGAAKLETVSRSGAVIGGLSLSPIRKSTRLNFRSAPSVLNSSATATRSEPAAVERISIPISFARTLRLHAQGILAYYDYPISTGPLEGTNNKIITMKRQAYGYRDQEFFKLKIYALQETKYALVG